jgi:hypothetical protein
MENFWSHLKRTIYGKYISNRNRTATDLQGSDRQDDAYLRGFEVLVERVGEARERKLRQMIRNFQNEGDTSTSHRQWKQIEKEVFGVQYND